MKKLSDNEMPDRRRVVEEFAVLLAMTQQVRPDSCTNAAHPCTIDLCGECLMDALTTFAATVERETIQDDAAFIQELNATGYPLHTSCVNGIVNLLNRRATTRGEAGE